MVGEGGREVERQGHSLREPRSGDRDRRVPPGVGCSLGRSVNWGHVVQHGEGSPHQPAGTHGRHLCGEDICRGSVERSHQAEDGQLHCSCVCQSHGRDKVPRSSVSCQASLDMVSGEGSDTLSRVPPWGPEH